MTGILKEKMRIFTANQFLNLFGIKKDAQWNPNTSYNPNDVVVYGVNRYITEAGGTSGSTPPTHVSGSASDGGVTWLFIESDVDTDYYENNVYGAIGKTTAWSDDLNPPAPQNNDLNETNILSNLSFYKRITEADAVLAITNYTWTSGTVYDEYDETIEDFAYANPFYVMNSEADKNIYKCLDNNGGSPSTSEPTGQSITPFTTADGYVWQYMGSVSASDSQNFLTADYIPVRKKLVDDGSVQWQVQQNAKRGSVNKVNVTNGGSGYLASPSVVVVPAAGETPSIPMTAIANVSGGVITSITVTEPGSGYVKAPWIKILPDAGDTVDHQPTITVDGVDGSGAITSISIVGAGQYIADIISVTVTSTNGTGAVLTPILDDNRVLTGFSIDNGGSQYDVGDVIVLDDGESYAHDYIFTVEMQPKDGHGANIIEELNAKNVIVNMKLELDEGGFLPTDISFRRLCLLVDPEVADNSGYATAPKYKGSDNANYVGGQSDEIKPGSGSLLYVENVIPVQRGSNQTEDIKFVLKF